MARCGGRAVGRACTHAVQRRIGIRHYVGHARGSTSTCSRGATRGASALRLPGYTRVRAALRRGLGGVLSAASTRPVGQATRGFIIELLARASRRAHRWAATE
jgi:hypothetical protein